MNLEPCLEAVAAGDGREVMQFDEARRLSIFLLHFGLIVRLRLGRQNHKHVGRHLHGARRW